MAEEVEHKWEEVEQEEELELQAAEAAEEEEEEEEEEFSSLTLRQRSSKTTLIISTDDKSTTIADPSTTSTRTTHLNGRNGNSKTKPITANGDADYAVDAAATADMMESVVVTQEKQQEEGPNHNNIAAALSDITATTVFHTPEEAHFKSRLDSSCVYYDPEDAGGSRSNSTCCGDEDVDGNTNVRKYDTREENAGAQECCDSVVECAVEGNKKYSSYLTSLQHSPVSHEERSESYNSQEIKEIENEDFDLINGIGAEVTEIDVERVLEKQNTHDLYCPNCNSCITRRVVLRKRKRRARITSDDVKRSKLQTEVESSLAQCFQLDQHVTSNEVHATEEIPLDDTFPPVVKYEPEKGPDIFRCLSCFSFFIPTGNGFKLFKLFGDKTEKKPVGDGQKLTSKGWTSETSEQGSISQSEALTTNSSISLLASHGNDQDGQSSMLKDLSTTRQNLIAESKEGRDKILPLSKEEIFIKRKEMLNAGADSNNTVKNRDTGDAVKGHLEGENGSQPKASNISINIVACHQSDSSKAPSDNLPVNNGESVITESERDSSNISLNAAACCRDLFKVPTNEIPVTNGVSSPEDSVPGNQLDGLQFLISSPGNSPTPGKLLVDKDPDLSTKNSVADGTYLNENSQQTICEKKKEVHDGEIFKINKDAAILLVKDISRDQDVPATIARDMRKVAAELSSGKDTVVVEKSDAISSVAGQRAQDPTISDPAATSANLTTNVSITEAAGADTRPASYQIEIIKSIVYGGLVESITSLGVVSSAAGGDTATLNVLALALANVGGGLVLIGHNLWDLKKEQVGEQVDRYKELLGSRENFVRHATVVIVSYVVFGVIPAAVYGLSFRRSGNRELKLIAVAAASLLCIIVLAIGKVYVGRRRPRLPKSYLKTIGYYMVLGLMVSGISYAVGELIKGLLLHFHTNSFLLPKMTPPTPAQWASY